MKPGQRGELQRTLGYVVTEARRYANEVLGDVEVTCLPVGDAPDAFVCGAVRAERDRAREFASTMERYAARVRGDR